MRSSFFTISDNRSSVNKKKARSEEKRPPQQSMFIPRNSAWRRLFFRSAINKKARQKAGKQMIVLLNRFVEVYSAKSVCGLCIIGLCISKSDCKRFSR